MIFLKQIFLSTMVLLTGFAATAMDMKVKKSCDSYFSQQMLCFDYELESIPQGRGETSMIVKFWRPNAMGQEHVGAPVAEPLGELDLQLMMPHHGHGSIPVKVTKLDVSTYKIEKVFFPMGGFWELRFQIKASNEKNAKIIDEEIKTIILPMDRQH